MIQGMWSLRNWEDDSFSDPGVGPVFVLLAMNPNHKGALNMEEFCEYVNEIEGKFAEVRKAWRNNYPPNAIERKIVELEQLIIKGGH